MGKIAVIENEFGDVGIDDALLSKNTKMQADEEIIEMMNGCICCTVRQDLITVLSKLAKRVASGKLKLDGIVIETTGLADPAPVAQTFFVDDAVKAFARLDGIVTLIDAKHGEMHLDEEKPEGVENEAVEQVAFADRLLLNKLDLVEESDVERIEKRLREVNKYAPIVRCTKADVGMEQVIDLKAFELARILEMDPEFLEDAEHEHDASVYSVGWKLPGMLNMERTNTWIANLLRDKGMDIYRMKGILSMAGCDDKYVYQGVHMLFTGEVLEPWGDAPRVNSLIFIGKNLNKEELLASFESCLEK